MEGSVRGGVRRVDTRNRVAVPRAALQALGIRSGDYVAFLVDGDGLVHVCRVELSLRRRAR